MAETVNANTTDGRDQVLDFWRGISISMVLLHHLVYFRYADFFKHQIISALNQTGSFVGEIGVWADKILLGASERSGPLGVKIFFVISGYIITKLLLGQEGKNGRIKAKHFYFKRVIRILPPLIFFFFSLLLFRALGWIGFSNSELFNSAGFLCDIRVSGCGWYFAHTWSLAIEEQFYLLWPAFFLIPFVNRKYRVQILALILVLLLSCSAFGFFTVAGWLDVPLSFACIAVGALYAMSQSFQGAMKKHGLLLIAALSLAAVSMFYLAPSWREVVHQTYRLIQPFVILTAIILTYRLNWLIKSKFFWAATKVGLISYSLYIWQQVFVAGPSDYLHNSFLTWPILMFAFAVFSYLFIEKSAMKWGKEVLKKYDTIRR